MKVSPELLELTNKFLKEFFALSAERDGNLDDSFNFHYTLPDAIAQSDYPRYKEQHTILMGMSSFDDSIAKAFFNNNIQGFTEIILKRLEYKGEQEDYIVDNIKTEDYLKDDFGLRFHKEKSGADSFTTYKKKTKAQKITFDVSNHRSGFKGNVVMLKKLNKEFIDDHNFVEKMTVEEIKFFVNKNEVMSIHYRYDYDTKKYYEEGTFHHYKYCADINSFYQTIVF
jgi:hypothetical protein